MRIRQVRPEFFSDPVTSKLPIDARLTYIGLWCVADDAGWLEWNVPGIGAVLYPYESVLVRERRVAKVGEALIEAGRMVAHECGCAFIPKLVEHQRIGGNKSYTIRDQHRVHTRADVSAGRVGNVEVGNVTEPGARAPGGAAPGPWEEKVAATLARDGR
jgi:hypothetical protein